MRQLRARTHAPGSLQSNRNREDAITAYKTLIVKKDCAGLDLKDRSNRDDSGASYFLPRLVGVSLASELMMTDRFINAARAGSRAGREA